MRRGQRRILWSSAGCARRRASGAPGNRSIPIPVPAVATITAVGAIVTIVVSRAVVIPGPVVEPVVSVMRPGLSNAERDTWTFDVEPLCLARARHAERHGADEAEG